MIWIAISTLVYGILCLLSRIVSEKAALQFAKWWLLHISFFSGCKMKLHNLDKLNPGAHYIFLANHQSVFDIIALYLSLPYRLSFIAKKSLFVIPLFGWGMAAIGHIAIDRGNPMKARKSIEKACTIIREKKRSIFAFPEGTRSKTGEMGEFKLGIFNLALQAGVDIVPVTLNGTRQILPKNSYFIRPGTVDIILHAPISVKDYQKSEKMKLADLTRETILRDLQTT